VNTTLICTATVIAIAGFLLSGASRRRRVAQSAFNQLRYQLIESPLDETTQNDLLSLSKVHPELLNSTYELALAILGAHKDSLVARQFAADAGRARYGSRRLAGKLTKDDERTIHKEITDRTGSRDSEERIGPTIPA
jgi:hypothetical protein